MSLIAVKLGMTQCFDSDFKSIPVTLLSFGSCVFIKKFSTKNILNPESLEFRVVIGFGLSKKPLKPVEGFFKSINMDYSCSFVKEFVVTSGMYDSYYSKFKSGDLIGQDMFGLNTLVDVRGVSKGKGFQGVIKRHKQARGPEAHGSRHHRRPGSMGASATPSRVMKGKKLPGRMGGVNVCVKNIQVVDVISEDSVIVLKGAVPGGNGAVLNIIKSLYF